MKRPMLFLAAACAACCAPLVAPVFMTVFGVGGLAAAGVASGFDWREAACLAVAAAAVGGLAWFFMRRRVKTAASCEVGGPCDPRTDAPRRQAR